MNAYSSRPRTYAAFLAAALALVIAIIPAVSGASPPAEPGARGLAQAIGAQEGHNASLFAIDGVVATGVGAVDGEAVVKVYTADASVRGIPASVGGFAVVVEAVGAITAQPDECGGPPWQRPPSCSGGVDTTARFDRPVPIGVSTGHPDITAGTIGARVTDGTNVYALSNNHVYANENLASLGDAVIQPGSYDGGSSPSDDIGTLDQYVDIVFDGVTENRVDAAIAMTTAGDLSNSTPADGYGTPSSTTAAASPGMDVIKYGRTTGQTSGSVDTINATVNVGYDTGTARFTGQVIISGDAGSFSQGGDSGSLIVAADGLQPVALLFAGNNSITVGNPIDEVLSAFGVTIDGADGASPTSTTTTSTTTTTAAPPGNLTVTGVDPDSVEVGGFLDDAVVSGTGFEPGATVSLANGSGPAPGVSDITFVSQTEITIDVSVPTNGPPRNRVWTVVVTNPGGASASGGTLTVIVP